MRSLAGTAMVLALVSCGSRREMPRSTEGSAAHAATEAQHLESPQPTQDAAAPLSVAAEQDAARSPVQVPGGTPAPTSSPKPTKSAASSAMRCTLRVSATGLYVDGDPKSQSEAVAICKSRAAAMVVLEDGVAKDEWKKVETALRREGIEILMRGPLGHAECLDNPLAKGCL